MATKNRYHGRVGSLFIALILLTLALLPYGIRTYNQATALSETSRAALGDLRSALERRAAIFATATDQIAKGDNYEVALQKTVLQMRQSSVAGNPFDQSARSITAVGESYPIPASIQLRRDFGGAVQEVEAIVQAKVERYNAELEAYNTFVSTIPAMFVLYPLGHRRVEFVASTNGLSNQENK